MKGLIIRFPWIDLILKGLKIWEIRGSNTKIRGRIALIQSGTGMILGYVDLVDCIELSIEKYFSGEIYHCVKDTKDKPLPYKKIYAWVLENAVLLDQPIPYKHPQGAVIWINLDLAL